MTLRSLLVRGPFRGPSGYDHHVRELVRALHRRGIAIQLVDVPEWGPVRLPPEKGDPWFESLTADVGARVALHFTMPHQVTPYPGLRNVNYTMFEASRVHPSWIGHNSRHDLVIVPTESSRRAWIDSGLDHSKVRVSPLGIDAELYGRPAEPFPIETVRGESISRFRVRFLNVSELGPRKNLIGLLRTWLGATTLADDAVLVLKLGGSAPGAWDEWQAAVEQLQRQVGRRLEEAAPVASLRTLLADDEMPRLYAAASHYVSLSFGEGWDQAMVEAAASGLSLIAPDHSAYRAYLDSATARLLPSRRVPADFPGGGPTGLLFRGAEWWQPDAAAAARAIRDAIDGRDEPPTPPRARVLRELTWDAAARQLMAHLTPLETARSASRRWFAGLLPGRQDGGKDR